MKVKAVADVRARVLGLRLGSGRPPRLGLGPLTPLSPHPNPNQVQIRSGDVVRVHGTLQVRGRVIGIELASPTPHLKPNPNPNPHLNPHTHPNPHPHPITLTLTLTAGRHDQLRLHRAGRPPRRHAGAPLPLPLPLALPLALPLTIPLTSSSACRSLPIALPLTPSPTRNP